ncbi:Env9p [Sugiyamaella lignohabitans]|uniref:Env9p n=1 Tax=Sugiyamaella lignohabitans TaxID=796027 RepID=A0A167D564_9ASCO|nr:Env9p [Sugiyamaella lignohabitans]ANB12495.1 Env9p [Sugiyamaella lignohabitans]
MTFDNQTTSEQVGAEFADNIKGKTVIVTGATWGGLGAHTALTIARHGAERVIIAGRKASSLEETIAKIKEEVPSANVTPLVFDLASLKTVRAAADKINSDHDIKHIDVLINNAAVMACPFSKTEDGFENQFGSNHLGHFLFTTLIINKILASKYPRIVNVSSQGHRFSPIRFDDVNFSNGEKYGSFQAYGQSKTANILFTRELNRRYASKGLVTFSLHPGVISTNLSRHIDFENLLSSNEVDYQGNPCFQREYLEKIVYKTISQGASTTLVAAFDPAIVKSSGSYMSDCVINEDLCLPFAKDMDSAERLWTLSEKLVAQA